MTTSRFSDFLKIDTGSEIDRICRFIQDSVLNTLHRRGAIVAVSGGIDSAVSAALCAKALGRRVVLLSLPEKDSSPESLRLAELVASTLGIEITTEVITPILETSGCYARQVDAIRKVFPAYADGWKNKLSIPSILDSDRLNVTRLTVQSPAGETMTERMPAAAYLQLVAATNFKQRIRTMMTYYHADRMNYAVCGTPNRLEYDQGFFVKAGDGSADFKPIAHLYKSQVYMLARALEIPEEIHTRPPTSDTFSLAQTQEEFYFSLPYEKMDLCLYALNHDIPANLLALHLGLTVGQTERIYGDIQAKRRSTRYLHQPALTVVPISEITEALQQSSTTHEGD